MLPDPSQPPPPQEPLAPLPEWSNSFGELTLEPRPEDFLEQLMEEQGDILTFVSERSEQQSRALIPEDIGPPSRHEEAVAEGITRTFGPDLSKILDRIPKEEQTPELLSHLNNLHPEVLQLLPEVEQETLTQLIVAMDLPAEDIRDALEKTATMRNDAKDLCVYEGPRFENNMKLLLIQVAAKIPARERTPQLMEKLLAVIRDDGGGYSGRILEALLQKSSQRIAPIIQNAHSLLRFNSSYETYDLIRHSPSEIVKVPESYIIKIDQSELSSQPKQVLHSLCEQFDTKEATRLNVSYTNKSAQSGLDAGGPGRQFNADLCSEVVKDKKMFQPQENGLMRPFAQVLPLSPEQKSCLQDLGKLFKFCENAKTEKGTPYPIGMIFDIGVFSALLKLEDKYLDKLDRYDPEVFDELFSIYSGMDKFSDAGIEKLERLNKILQAAEEETFDAATLQMAFATMLPDFPEQLISNPDTIRKNLPQIREALKQAIFEDYIRPALVPIGEIAKGMKEAPFSDVTWDDTTRQKLTPEQLSTTLQGTVKKEDILKKLKFEEETPPEIKMALEEWIKEADEEKIKKFIYAVSGSPALGKRIKIENEEALKFGTCFNEMKLNYEGIMNAKDAGTGEPLTPKEALRRLVDPLIDFIYQQKGFDEM